MTKKAVICSISFLFSAVVGVKVLQAFLLCLKKFGITVDLDVTLLLFSTLFAFAFFGLYLSFRWSKKIKERHIIAMTAVFVFVIINDFYYNFFWVIFSWF